MWDTASISPSVHELWLDNGQRSVFCGTLWCHSEVDISWWASWFIELCSVRSRWLWALTSSDHQIPNQFTHLNPSGRLCWTWRNSLQAFLRFCVQEYVGWMWGHTDRNLWPLTMNIQSVSIEPLSCRNSGHCLVWARFKRMGRTCRRVRVRVTHEEELSIMTALISGPHVLGYICSSNEAGKSKEQLHSGQWPDTSRSSFSGSRRVQFG